MVPHRQSAIINELIHWAIARNNTTTTTSMAPPPAYEDLILVSIWDCTGGDDCTSQALAEFTDVGIPVLESSEVNGLTAGSALERAKLKGGGYILAVNGDASAPGFHTYDDLLK